MYQCIHDSRKFVPPACVTSGRLVSTGQQTFPRTWLGAEIREAKKTADITKTQGFIISRTEGRLASSQHVEMVRKSGENFRGGYLIEEKISGGRFVKEDRSDP